MLTSGATVQDVELKLSHLAADVCAWANLNRKALNASKTKSMLLASPRKLGSLGRHRQCLRVTVYDTVVEQVHLAKIQGVLFDDHLSWEQHFDDLCKRLKVPL